MGCLVVFGIMHCILEGHAGLLERMRGISPLSVVREDRSDQKSFHSRRPFWPKLRILLSPPSLQWVAHI